MRFAMHFLTAALITSALLGGAGPALADTQLTGAGSTFAYPFFSRAFFEYAKEHRDVSVNYQSIGSGGGIQQFIARTVDFGASDVPLNPKELKAAEDANGAVIQIPITLGGVAIAYNVPGAPAHLKFTPSLLVAIFMGKIAKWDDPEIAKINPGAKLPGLPIVVVHRADGSGTTFIFTDYLSKISAEWKEKVGNAKTVNWPAPSAVGAKGNEGVAGQVRITPGAIGYVELAYVLQNDIAYGAVLNRAGDFVLPAIATVQTAAAQKPNVSPTDFSIVDQPGKGSYPISGYVWVMVWKNPSDPVRGKVLTNLFQWLVTSGQSYAVDVKYVGLPRNVTFEAAAALKTVDKR